jgi:hypothetical protein
MARLIKAAVVIRRRGRPRTDNVRIECMVPKEVMRLLVQREQAGQGYRTRIAANVLCQWASRETGKPISAYNSLAR